MSKHIELVRHFIAENFLFDASEEKLKNNDSLLDQGIIDSTGVLELVEWLEDTFGISIDDEELIPENLDSVNNLATFISRKV